MWPEVVEIVGSGLASIMVTIKAVVKTHMGINTRAKFISFLLTERMKECCRMRGLEFEVLLIFEILNLYLYTNVCLLASL